MAKGILPKEQWLECLRPYAELRGIFIGGCVDRGVGSSFRAGAHAHTRITDGSGNVGWICVRAERKAFMPEVMLHELAHILTRQGHTAKWRAKVLEIGGTLDPVPGALRSYHARAK